MRYAWIAAGVMIGLGALAPQPELSAQEPGEEPLTFHACRVGDTGVIYMIQEPGLPEQCLSPNHTEFSWTESGTQGPEGPEGPTGPAGPQGPEGPQGEPGELMPVVRVASPSEPVGASSPVDIVVPCPEGTVVVSAGYSMSQSVKVFRVDLNPVLNEATVTFRLVDQVFPDPQARAWAYCAPGS